MRLRCDVFPVENFDPLHGPRLGTCTHVIARVWHHLYHVYGKVSFSPTATRLDLNPSGGDDPLPS